MSESKIIIPNADDIMNMDITNDLYRQLFYCSLLVAIADNATELQVLPGDDLGPVIIKTKERQYEFMLNCKVWVEQEIASLSKINQADLVKEGRDIHFIIEINGKLTDVIARIRPEVLVLRFLNPEKASEQARIITERLVCLPEF